MSEYKQCPNGHYYDSAEYDRCPYCPREYVSIEDVHPMSDRELAIRMMTIPICKHCGHPLRKGIPRPPYGIAVSSLTDIRDNIVPWNYQWDGKCEHCGHDYNITMMLNMDSYGHDNKTKQTTIKVSSKEYCHDFECCQGEGIDTVLSGVEIHTKTDIQDETVFISSNELKYLLQALRDSPLCQQFDYETESSVLNIVRT